MKSYRTFLQFLFVFALIVSCENPFEPEPTTRLNLKEIIANPVYAEGLLSYAYAQNPELSYRLDEVATDDAVSNQTTNAYLRMATGGWTSLYNPQDMWTRGYKAIMNINLFLEVVDQVTWKSKNKVQNQAFVDRMKGEAYGLRGIFKYYLLRNHGGIGKEGQLLGIPKYDQFIREQEGFNIPRESFLESIKGAYQDLDKAIDLLPMDYIDATEVPQKYEGLNIAEYNMVIGNEKKQKLSGRIAMAYKARLALLAASPSFNLDNNPDLWEDATKLNGILLKSIGGISGLDPKGHIFWQKEQVDNANLATGDKTDISEILWRRSLVNEHSLEYDNYPPTIYGRGRVNPTQNLVDAFPMKNGYPINDAISGYDNQHPYTNRDPRFYNAIVYNGYKMRGTIINTIGGVDNNSVGKSDYATKTGYYLRKLLREDINCDPKKTTNQYHIYAIIRYTEIFLNYAEAANEVWGPDGSGEFGFSARDVIAAIRKRAGITQPDNYLASVGDKDKMRNLIQNERRLELCFEGFRFWDLRRWKASLTETAKGIDLKGNDYIINNVEERNYKEYMNYGPIPYYEALKFKYIQNQGW